jgi:hypothetical protein
MTAKLKPQAEVWAGGVVLQVPPSADFAANMKVMVPYKQREKNMSTWAEGWLSWIISGAEYTGNVIELAKMFYPDILVIEPKAAESGTQSEAVDERKGGEPGIGALDREGSKETFGTALPDVEEWGF